MAAAAGRPLDVLVEGYAYGPLSLASYTVGACEPTGGRTPCGPAALRGLTVVPADDTNM